MHSKGEGRSNSPEQGTVVTQLLKLVRPALVDFLSLTSGDIQLIMPIEVPHSDHAKHDNANKAPEDDTVAEEEARRLEVDERGADASKVTHSDDHREGDTSPHVSASV